MIEGRLVRNHERSFLFEVCILNKAGMRVRHTVAEEVLSKTNELSPINQNNSGN